MPCDGRAFGWAGSDFALIRPISFLTMQSGLPAQAAPVLWAKAAPRKRRDTRQIGPAFGAASPVEIKPFGFVFDPEADMPENFAEQHRNIEFSNNVEATLRQMPGILYPLCGSSDSYTGSKAARITNRFGRVKMSERTTRNGDTPTSDISSVARFIIPGRTNDIALLKDPDDEEVTQVDLGSALVNEVAAAAATYHDDMFIYGFFGNGWTGETGSTAVPFKAANIIAHGGVGITQAKLMALEELIRTRHVNVSREKPIIMLTAADKKALDSIEEYKNSLYNENKPLADGELKPWGIFRFFHFEPDAESLPTSYANIQTGVGYRQLPVIIPSGMHRGIWHEFKGRIGERADKSYAEQTYGSARSACVRTDEDKAFILRTV